MQRVWYNIPHKITIKRITTNMSISINSEGVKEQIADLATQGFNGAEIATTIDKTNNSTFRRAVYNFLNTYECDQLRGIEADMTDVEQWKKTACNLKNLGLTNKEISLKIFGNDSTASIYKLYTFFKTSIAYNLLQKDVDIELTADEEFRVNELKILYWDIETSPCVSYHYQHWKVNIRQDQAIKQSHLLSVSYSFNDEEPVGFRLNPSEVAKEDDLTLVVNMIEAIEKADVIVGYNSKRFDMKVLNTRALYWGLPPIKPAKHIDLYDQVKKLFRFPSNSLGNVSAYLQLEGKLITDRGLWRRCMEHWNEEECEAALIDMLTYNKQDIEATRDLYYRIRGWTHNPVNIGAITNVKNAVEEYDEEGRLLPKVVTPRCTKCGSDDITPVEGSLNFTTTRGYSIYRCNVESCKGVSRLGSGGNLANCALN